MAKKSVTSNSVFVFGSNLAGRHGKGAAYFAVKYHGAKYGQGIGHQGNSYAIPTKDAALNPLPLDEIRLHIRDFLKYATKNEDLVFKVTPIGCGLAGYRKPQIMKLFHEIAQTESGKKSLQWEKKTIPIPANVTFTKEWFDL